MSFAEELKNDSIKTWKNILEHAFIQALSNDTLPKENFIVYLLQDRIFLKEFCILLENIRKLSHDKNIRKWINELIQAINENELKMQDELLEILRYSDYDTNIVSLPMETTLKYIYDMRNLSGEELSGKTSKLYELVSFTAPCPWTYYEIADKIRKENIVKDKATKKWIDFYSSYESKRQVDFIIHLINDVVNDLTAVEKFAMKNCFRKACTNELDFWDMAYQTKKLTRLL
jgi:thiaminase (transcriptional activator TenA)